MGVAHQAVKRMMHALFCTSVTFNKKRVNQFQLAGRLIRSLEVFFFFNFPPRKHPPKPLSVFKMTEQPKGMSVLELMPRGHVR